MLKSAGIRSRVSQFSMAFINNNMPNSPFKEILKDKSVVLSNTASQTVSLHVMHSIACVSSCKGSLWELSQVGLSNCCL